MVISKKIKEAVLTEIDKLSSNNAYHNREHVETVLKNLDKLQDHLTEELTKDEELMLRVAILYHDYGHPGYEVRSECPKEIPNKDLTNEEYAALVCGEALEIALAPEQVQTIQRIILTTSMGNKYPAETKLEKLMAFVDIANFMNSKSAIKEDAIKLSKEKCSRNPLDKESQELFLQHIRKCLDNIQEYITDKFYQELKLLIN